MFDFIHLLPGNRSKSSGLNIKWHVEHVSVPSHAPKPSKSMLLFTTTSSNESPIFPLALIFVPSALINETSTLKPMAIRRKCAESNENVCLVGFS